MPGVTGVPVPSAEELSALPAAELAVRLAEAYRLIAELTAQAGRLAAQVERLSGRVEELERQARKDSSTSSRPPSSDSPYRKKGGDRSLRERGKRRPGKQPGDPGMTMNLVDDPDETVDCPPAACRGCGADLASAPVTAQRRHQVTDIAPASAPKVIEYVAQAKECAGCGMVTAAELAAYVRARASYGPETCAPGREPGQRPPHPRLRGDTAAVPVPRQATFARLTLAAPPESARRTPRLPAEKGEPGWRPAARGAGAAGRLLVRGWRRGGRCRRMP